MTGRLGLVAGFRGLVEGLGRSPSPESAVGIRLPELESGVGWRAPPLAVIAGLAMERSDVRLVQRAAAMPRHAAPPRCPAAPPHRSDALPRRGGHLPQRPAQRLHRVALPDCGCTTLSASAASLRPFAESPVASLRPLAAAPAPPREPCPSAANYQPGRPRHSQDIRRRIREASHPPGPQSPGDPGKGKTPGRRGKPGVFVQGAGISVRRGAVRRSPPGSGTRRSWRRSGGAPGRRRPGPPTRGAPGSIPAPGPAGSGSWRRRCP